MNRSFGQAPGLWRHRGQRRPSERQLRWGGEKRRGEEQSGDRPPHWPSFGECECRDRKTTYTVLPQRGEPRRKQTRTQRDNQTYTKTHNDYEQWYREEGRSGIWYGVGCGRVIIHQSLFTRPSAVGMRLALDETERKKAVYYIRSAQKPEVIILYYITVSSFFLVQLATAPMHTVVSHFDYTTTLPNRRQARRE